MSPAKRARPWHVAVVSMIAILLWWTAVVHWAYGGFWNALYCNGSAARFPAWLEEREPLYRVASPAGYDGQWYHLLAHRPLEYRQSAAYMDWPRLRCQRLLFPLLVWLLALGLFVLVDPAFFGLMLASLGSGVYFTARLAELRGRTPLWGLAFLAMPASLGSIERMLLDGPMLAAAAAMLFFLEAGRWRAAWVCAALAPLLRESGLLLVAAIALLSLRQHLWLRAAAWLAAALPAVLWMAWTSDLPGGASYTWAGLFGNLARSIHRTQPYPYPGPWRELLQALDIAALCALLAAVLAALWLAWRVRNAGELGRQLPLWTAALFAAAGLASSCVDSGGIGAMWDEAYGYGRVLTPILFFLLLEGWAQGRLWPPLAALAPVALRVALHPAAVTWRAISRLAEG
jgi:hypothetical protein